MAHLLRSLLPPSESANKTLAQRQRVLLVEDDDAVREALTFLLEQTYEVNRATTGAQALAILDRQDVAVVLLDYRLPDRTGLDLLTAIKSTRPWLPVIMMTGYGSEWLCASALKGGVSDYFPKPFNAYDLLDSIRRILLGDSRTQKPREDTFTSGSRKALLIESYAGSADFSIQKATRLVQQRYWDHISLSDLAHDVGMSKYLLSRRFRKVMGVTFRDYLLKLRVERAKELLSGRHLSITQVAQMVGFGDLPRFDKLFKRYTGVTPSAYRTKHLLPPRSSKNSARNLRLASRSSSKF